MKRIIFDLDGTLLDTLPDIHGVIARLLAAEGLPALPLETVRGFIGRGAPALVDQLIAHTGQDPKDATRLLKAFVDDYEDATSLTHPYPGVETALAALEASGLALSICTNKPSAPTRRVIEAMHWTGRFDPVIGGDSFPVRKPDPTPLFAAAEGTSDAECLYVGDSEVDAETAKAAGITFALFTQGYRKSPVAEIPHDFAFDDFSDLPSLVAGATAR